VFCDRCKIKSNKGLRVKVTVVVQIEKEKEKEKKARTTALGGAKRLNKAQIIQRRLQIIEESNKQIIIIINEL
jgi:hypothetical protein